MAKKDQLQEVVAAVEGGGKTEGAAQVNGTDGGTPAASPNGFDAKVQDMMEDMAAKVGLSLDVLAEMGVADKFQQVLKTSEERWAEVKGKLEAALPDIVGGFDGYSTITVTRTDNGFEVERDTGKKRGGGNGGGKGTPKPCHIGPTFQQKYGLRGGYPSVRQLSHALADALKVERPADSGTGRFIRAKASDLAESLLADGHTLT